MAERNKNREEALSQLAAPETDPTEAPKADRKAAFEGVEAQDFGGTVKVGVVFDIYRVNVDGTWRDASKGDVIKVTAEVADRGEELDGLVRL